MSERIGIRLLLTVALIAILAVSCAPPGPQTSSVEPRDAGHVDSGGAGGGAM